MIGGEGGWALVVDAAIAVGFLVGLMALGYVLDRLRGRG